MISKNDICVGDTIVVNDLIVDGLPSIYRTPGQPPQMPSLPVMSSCNLTSQIWEVSSGTELEVLRKPHREKVSGANVIKIRIVGTSNEGYVYWCAARLSCSKKELQQ